MKKMTDTTAASRPAWDMLKTFARTQVQGFIQHLLEDEVTELLGRAKSARRAPLDASAGARNGQGKPRQLALMNGTITVRRPDRYLHGLALGDFELALRGLLGDAAPLSASSLVRLKATWQAQYAAWQHRDLSDCRVVSLWADGVYVKTGLDTGKAALLVLIGADAAGQKTVLAVTSGQRESTESWAAVLRDLKRRGLRAPKLTIADGHLGIWSALAQVYPESAEQRCWNHKLRNVLDTVSQKHQAEVKAALQARRECGHRARGDGAPRPVRADVWAGAPQGRGALDARLGADGGLLCLPAGTLAAPAHDDHHRVTLRGSPAPHLGREALQGGGERDRPHLENAAGRRAALPQAERPAPLHCDPRWRDLPRWDPRQHPCPRTARRLTPFTHFLTRAHLCRDPCTRTRRHAQPVASYQRVRQRDVPRPRAHERIAHRELGPPMASRLGKAIRGTPRARLAGVHPRARIARIGLGTARPIGLHRGVVRIRHDHLVAERLQVTGHPLALRARLEQNTGARPRAQHGGEPLPARDDPTIGDRVLVRFA